MHIEDLRRWLQTRAGRAIAGVAVAGSLLGAAYSASGVFGDSDAAQLSAAERPFICAQTGKPFTYDLKRGDVVPVLSPHSSQPTGFPAEKCYWTADGHAKEAPTLVLLEEYAGHAGKPTFCPDCGRRVVAHNPAPDVGSPPPPTREEYAASVADRKAGKRGTRRGGAGAAAELSELEQR